MVAMSLIRAPTSWSWSGELKAGMDGVVEGVQGAWAREHKGGIDSSLLSTWLRGRINSPLNNALVPFSDIISLWSFLPSRCIPLRSGRQISPPRCEIFSLGYSHIFYSSPLNWEASSSVKIFPHFPCPEFIFPFPMLQLFFHGNCCVLHSFYLPYISFFPKGRQCTLLI